MTEDVKECSDMRPNVYEQRASSVQANANEQRESTELESRSDLVQGQCGEVYHQAVSTDAQQSSCISKLRLQMHSSLKVKSAAHA